MNESHKQQRAQSVLCTPTAGSAAVQRLQQHKRGASAAPGARAQVKPVVLESKVCTKETFFNLSDGFKRCFSNDSADQRMVVPVCGYSGHRRGNNSQNFFGKSFKETSIQSKFLERQLRQKN